MKRITIEVVRDDTAEDRRAIIRLVGIERVVKDITYRIEPVDDLGDKRDGWPSGDLKPGEIRTTERGVELLVGPEVVDAPSLLPATAVAIVIPSLDLRRELLWPLLPVSKLSARAAPIPLSRDQRIAQIAARAEAQRAELARITAAQIEAERAERKAGKIRPQQQGSAVATPDEVLVAGSSSLPAVNGPGKTDGAEKRDETAASNDLPPPVPVIEAAAPPDGVPDIKSAGSGLAAKAEPAGSGYSAKAESATAPPLPAVDAALPDDPPKPPPLPPSKAPKVAEPALASLSSTAEAQKSMPPTPPPLPALRHPLANALEVRSETEQDDKDLADAGAVLARQVTRRADAPPSWRTRLPLLYGTGFAVSAVLALAAGYLVGQDKDDNRRSDSISRQLMLEAESLRQKVTAQAEAQRQIEIDTARKLAAAEADKQRAVSEAKAALERGLAEAEVQRKADAQAAERAVAETRAAFERRMAEAEKTRKAEVQAATERAEAALQAKAATEAEAKRKADEKAAAERVEAERQAKAASEAEAKRKADEKAAAERAEAERQAKAATEAEAERQARAAAEAHARRMVLEHAAAERAETERQAKAAADAESSRKAQAPRYAAAAAPARQPAAAAPSSQACTSIPARANLLSGGMVALDVEAPCLAGRDLTVSYGPYAFAVPVGTSGRAEFSFDLFEGPLPLALTADGQRVDIDVSGADFSQVSKVAVVWSSPVDLDLHALEYLAARGGAGHVWSGQPSSRDQASAATRDSAQGHGFMSRIDAGDRGEAAKAEVYTFLHKAGQRSGAVTLFIDYASRGDTPAGEYCGDGSLARLEATVIRLHPGGRIERETVRLGPAACGQTLREGERFNPDTLGQLLARG